VNAVVILWDEPRHRIALKAASNGDVDAYAVSMPSGGHSGTLRTKSFLANIGRNAPHRELYPATWTESEKCWKLCSPPDSLGRILAQGETKTAGLAANMDDKRKKDLEEVMRTESRRGRRPIDLEARRQHAEKLKTMRIFLTIGSEEEFAKAMRDAGVPDGSQEFLEALRTWRAYRP